MNGDSVGETIFDYFLALLATAFIAAIPIFPIILFGSYGISAVLDGVLGTRIHEWGGLHPTEALISMVLLSVGLAGIMTGNAIAEGKFKKELDEVRWRSDSEVESVKSELKEVERQLTRERQSIQHERRELNEATEQREKEVRWYAQSIRRALSERAGGFRSLHASVAELDELVDIGISDYLRNKRRPAVSAAETVKRETKARRAAEVEAKTARSIVEYYEQMFPELADIRQNELEGGEEEQEADNTYTERERQDPVTRFIAKIEYSKLTPQQRSQLALERYWRRRHSPKELGRMYERYVGYLYESKGYAVDYTGIKDGLGDLGRDLVCTKGKTVEIVQCKYWSQYKSVYENRIFQHFGTVFEYKMQHKGVRVIPVFYTTTKLSDTARRFAEVMKMKLVEMHEFDKSYPCIKCNIGRDGSKIYHLPFDQQYDKVNIEPEKGEFFAKTIKEAEDAGFRRAYRWRGSKS